MESNAAGRTWNYLSHLASSTLRSKFIFSLEQFARDLPLAKIHTLVVGRIHTNCYILQSDSTALVIDPGDESERIIRFLKDIAVKPTHIVATHTHFDHVLGVDTIRAKLKIPFLIHRDDLSMLESMQSRVHQIMGFSVPPPPKVDQFLVDGQSIEFGHDKV